MDWRTRAELTERQSYEAAKNEAEKYQSLPLLKSYPLNAVDAQLFLDVTKFYIGVRDLMEFRRVSKEFAEVIQNLTRVRNQVTFYVCGKHPNYKSATGNLPSPIQALLSSTFKWTHLKFSDVDLENDFLGKEELFDKFVDQTCLVSLKSLILVNCYCGMGRFTELLSFCNYLTELKIVNCPSIFETGFEIINWRAFISPFCHQLKKIDRLTVIDCSRKKSSFDSVEFWMSNMSHLVALDLRSLSDQLPIQSVVQVVTNNCKTLRHFTLVGKWDCFQEVLTKFSDLRLQSLMFGNVKLEFYNGLKEFLDSQHETLQSLHLQNMPVHIDSLAIIAKFSQLSKLHFEDICFVGYVVTVAAENAHPLSKLATLTDFRIQDSGRKSCHQWMLLLGNNPTFHLTTLVVRSWDVNIIINLFPQPCLQFLKVLVLLDVGIKIPELNSRIVWIQRVMTLNTLEKLEIINGKFIDSDFKPPQREAGVPIPPTLRDLTCLIMLNLSRMAIGDDLLLNHIVNLKTLEALYMDETQVSYNGMKSLAQRRLLRNKLANTNWHCLPKLRMISARRCLKLRESATMLRELNEMLPDVQLYCDFQVIKVHAK